MAQITNLTANPATITPGGTATITASIVADDTDVDTTLDVLITAGTATATIPVVVTATPPPPPPTLLTIANANAVVTDTTVLVTVDCSPDLKNTTIYEGTKKAAADCTPTAGKAAWTLTNVPAGDHTYILKGWTTPAGTPGPSTPTLSVTATVGGPTPPPPPPPPPPVGGVTINATPTGPPVPAGGWKPIFADAFANQGDYTKLSNMWIPNRKTSAAGDQQPFNGNEIAWFNRDNVSITTEGCVLTSQPGSGHPLRSACITSNPSLPGFSWLPGTGGQWAFEAVLTCDTDTGGNDPGWWASGATWAQEFDFFEYWGWGSKLTTYGSWLIGGHVVTQRKNTLPYTHDGKQHRYTHLFDDTNRKIRVWVDGTSSPTNPNRTRPASPAKRCGCCYPRPTGLPPLTSGPGNAKRSSPAASPSTATPAMSAPAMPAAGSPPAPVSRENTMPTRLCLAPGCPHPAAYRGRCPDHARTNDQTINRAGRKIYSSARWRHTRERYLLEHPLCERCGALGTDVHHRIDLADGGDPWSFTNLEGLCHACHSRITRAGQIP